MSIPPCLMHVRIRNEEHNFGLWLPLFLAWLILAALVLAVLPIFFMAARLGGIHTADRTKDLYHTMCPKRTQGGC
jgi:hypothetical protein